LVVLAAQLAFVAPAVRGPSTCPSAAEVARRLTPLLPATTGGGEAEVVEVVPTDGAAIVRLREADGHVSHERVLERAAGCDARADEAAVLVAAWEADLHADVVFPALPAPAPVALPVVASAPPAPPQVTPPPAVPVAVTAKQGGENRAPPFALALGAEVFVAAPAFADGTPAGAVELTGAGGGRVHGRVALLATGTHDLALSPGRVAWRRAALGAGALVDLVRGRVSLDARVGALAGVIVSRGSGFTTNYDATSAQVGADAGLRVGVPLTPRFALWAELSGAVFPGRQRLSVLNVPSAPELPTWEIDGGLGASFSLFP
jgi:hypothetical protein